MIELIDHYNSMMIYSNILKDEILACIYEMVKTRNFDLAYEIKKMLILEAEKKSYSGNLFRAHIYQKVLEDENVFTIRAEKKEKIGQSLEMLLKKDFEKIDMIVKELTKAIVFDMLLYDYKPSDEKDDDIKNFETDNYEKLYVQLNRYHNKYGAGDFSKYPMFTIEDEKLKAIKINDDITLDNLSLYKKHKKLLSKNIEAFIKGKEYSNVFLTAERGFAKASICKALANDYFDKGLRLIEIRKENISSLRKIVENLSNRGLKFILLFEDLSIDKNDFGYNEVKSLLAYAIQKRPANIVFYASSNKNKVDKEIDNNKKSEDITNRDLFFESFQDI